MPTTEDEINELEITIVLDGQGFHGDEYISAANFNPDQLPRSRADSIASDATRLTDSSEDETRSHASSVATDPNEYLGVYDAEKLPEEMREAYGEILKLRPEGDFDTNSTDDAIVKYKSLVRAFDELLNFKNASVDDLIELENKVMGAFYTYDASDDGIDSMPPILKNFLLNKRNEFYAKYDTPPAEVTGDVPEEYRDNHDALELKNLKDKLILCNIREQAPNPFDPTATDDGTAKYKSLIKAFNEFYRIYYSDENYAATIGDYTDLYNAIKDAFDTYAASQSAMPEIVRSNFIQIMNGASEQLGENTPAAVFPNDYGLPENATFAQTTKADLELIKEEEIAAIEANKKLGAYTKKQKLNAARQMFEEIEEPHSVLMHKSKENKLGFIKGHIPSTFDDASALGQPFEDFPQNEKKLIGDILNTVSDVKTRLTKGAFNNFAGQPATVTDQHKIPRDELALKLASYIENVMKKNPNELTQTDIEEMFDCFCSYNKFAQEEEGTRQKAIAVSIDNNREAIGTDFDRLVDFLATVPAPAYWNQLTEALTEIAYAIAVRAYANADPAICNERLSLACQARAVQEVGGGVCSTISAIVHGELMKKLPPGSEIAQVSHSAHHTFTVARVPEDSRWFIADAWPDDSAAIPFVDGVFDPSGVLRFFITEVTGDNEHPHGVNLDIDDFNWPNMLQQAKNGMELYTFYTSEIYGHPNTIGVDESMIDHRLKGKSSWGP